MTSANDLQRTGEVIGRAMGNILDRVNDVTSLQFLKYCCNLPAAAGKILSQA